MIRSLRSNLSGSVSDSSRPIPVGPLPMVHIPFDRGHGLQRIVNADSS
jgi:hypothetical protein